MEKSDGLQELIKKVEDLAIIKTVIQQATYSLRNGGDRPIIIPALNDLAMTDLLSDLLDVAFSKK